jgi:ZIP family zinc transporter
MVALVLFDLLPSVFAYPGMGRQAMMATALGFLWFFMLERYTALHQAREHHGAAPGHASELGTLAAAGLSLHSFFDGIAIGVGFNANFSLGTTIALAVILHDMSDGLNTVTVVLAHGNQLRRSMIWLAIDMFAPILGVASTFFFHWPTAIIPWLLAFFAGFFLYMGASDLLPEARKSRSPVIAVATVSGMVLVFFLSQVLPQ